MPTRVPSAKRRPISGKPTVPRKEVWTTTSPIHVPDPKYSWISGDSLDAAKVTLPIVKLTRAVSGAVHPARSLRAPLPGPHGEVATSQAFQALGVPSWTSNSVEAGGVRRLG
eukprot:Skav227390  [mRNA]  locus=scaffold3215:35369:42877:- [translate_table: standard]